MPTPIDDDVRELDLRGLKCPLPALRTARALRRLPVGATLIVRCTDPLAAIDIPHLVAQRGDELIDTSRGNEEIMFRLRRSAVTLPRR